MLKRFLYRSYCGFHRLEHWWRIRLTPAGRVAGWALIISGITGLNIFHSAIYQILILVLAYGILAGGGLFFTGLFFRPRIEVARVMPEYATAGRSFTYLLDLVNLSDRTEKGLVLFESLLDPRPSIETLETEPEPGEEERNWWDRKTLYYRWVWQVRSNEKVKIDPLHLPDLPPGARIRVRATVTPHIRGRLNLEGVILASPEPLGLFYSLTRIPLAAQLLILPETFDLAFPDSLAGRRHQPGGVWLASSVGNADEFRSLRDFRPGDSLRLIHWKTYARTRTLTVREFEDAFFVRHALVLDTDPDPADRGGAVQVFETAVSIAASLVRGIHISESILDLVFAGEQIYSFSWGRGTAGPARLLEALALVRPRPEPADPDQGGSALRVHVEENLDQFSGAIFIFIAWDRAREGLVARMGAAGIPVRVILVCPKGARERAAARIKALEKRTALPRVTLVTAGRASAELGVS